MTGYTELSKNTNNRILVVGGYLKDVEIIDYGHRAKIAVRPGGSAFNVAFCLSKLGFKVLFISCFEPGENREWPFDSLRANRNCSGGTFVYRGMDVLAVKRPSLVTLSEEVLSLIGSESFALVYATLDIGLKAAVSVSSLESSAKIVDPSPQIEFRDIADLEGFDFIIGNDYMKLREGSAKLIVKASSEGVLYRGKVFPPPEKGRDKFGSGDLFGAFFSRFLLEGLPVERAIERAVEESSAYCMTDLPLPEYAISRIVH